MVVIRNKHILVLSLCLGLFLSPAVSVLSAELGDIKLLSPDLTRGKLLMQALKERKSVRAFSEKELPLDVLSNLLWAASGVNRPEQGLRTAPTAVNWQEIDIYVAMKEGLYIYNSKEHSLELLKKKDIRKFAGKQDFVQKAPVTLIYVADFAKMAKEQNIQEFHAATDTGFISQNVYLFCASEGLSTVVLGWVDKEALKSKMKLKRDQYITLTQPVGYPE